MPNLVLWNDCSRADVHAIFSPETPFTPQAGTWGLQGMVRVPARHGDWVFFVTFGQEQGDHVFDEAITDDGVLSWQSQPAQRLTDATIQQLIQHDERINNIHLFLRTKTRIPYSYLGTLGYLTHDSTREKPVHFQWQLLEWPAPTSFLDRIGLTLVTTKQEAIRQRFSRAGELIVSSPPPPKPPRQGVITNDFHHNKTPDYAAQDARNRALGLQGEELVLAREKSALVAAGRHDLAEQVVHVSIVEGDSAGYDIRSFWPDGRVRYIEVKTTQGNAYSSFYISPNEIAFSAMNHTTYCLYRLYDFDQEQNCAQMYLLEGDISVQLNLTPTSYKAQYIGTSIPANRSEV